MKEKEKISICMYMLLMNVTNFAVCVKTNKQKTIHAELTLDIL